MPKIIKNGREYSGTPLEEVTAWPPTGDSVQIEQPLMGSTDISEVGDGTVTGAIAQNAEDITELNNDLHLQNKTTMVDRAVAKGYSSWHSEDGTFPVDGYSYFRATIFIESAVVGNTVTFNKDELVLTSQSTTSRQRILASAIWNTSNVGALQIYFNATSGLGQYSVSAKTVDYPTYVVIEGFN